MTQRDAINQHVSSSESESILKNVRVGTMVDNEYGKWRKMRLHNQKTDL